MRPRILRTILAIIGLSLVASAHAQLFRAYLSSTGNDANACTVSAPCRLLPAALAAVQDGGEVWMLDSANYNTSTVGIAKSVSILAVPGAVGSLVHLNGSAISITASGIKVSLRNVVIKKFPGSTGTADGIALLGASTLVLDGCTVSDMPNHGIFVNVSAALTINNSILRNNANFAVNQGGGYVSISNTKIIVEDGAGGLRALATSATSMTMHVTDSVISQGSASQTGLGVVATASSGSATVKVYLARSTVEGLGYGLVADTTGVTGSVAVVTIGGDTVANNAIAWSQAGTGSAIQSLGNNNIVDTGGAIGTLTTVSTM